MGTLRSYRWNLAAVAVAGCLGAHGCAVDRSAAIRRLESPRASERILAIVDLTEQIEAAPNQGASNADVIPLLVDRLEDEDEGVRFYAIVALEKLTGTRLGYCYAEPYHLRRKAVERWRTQLADRSQGAEPDPTRNGHAAEAQARDGSGM